jgi:carbohydrate kinase (thermoresistant glucokinase family)
MGVSGSGKSTLGAALAKALLRPFIEADALHPAANIAKMRAGLPLDETDRSPWLDAVAAAIAAAEAGTVAACSCLRVEHRDRLRLALGADLAFVLPRLDPEEIARRMESRAGHFMPASLLPSQLATFEPPGPDERVLEVRGSLGIADQVNAVLSASWPAQAKK